MAKIFLEDYCAECRDFEPSIARGAGDCFIRCEHEYKCERVAKFVEKRCSEKNKQDVGDEKVGNYGNTSDKSCKNNRTSEKVVKADYNCEDRDCGTCEYSEIPFRNEPCCTCSSGSLYMRKRG